jgi:uncharacterized protein
MKLLVTNCLALACFATLIPVTTQAQANPRPSFDCYRARSDVEIAICASPTLAAQDRAIASLYKRIRATSTPAGRAALLADQRQFLRTRDACYGPEGNGIDCLEGALAERVRELNGWLRSGYR